MKVVYITRHTKPDKTKYIKSDNELEQNKSIELSEQGIKDAKNFFKKKEFNDIQNIYCSDYKRSYETGELSDKNVIIDKRLGERITGTPDYSLTPNEYFYKQVLDENYKFINGESKKEIQNRMYNALIDILNKESKTIIISHGTSMTFLLMKLCNVEITNIENKIRKISFNNKIIFEDKFNFLQTFKLVFNDDNKLIKIESLEII